MEELDVFKRVVVKASGQAFAGTSGSGIDPTAVGRIADEVIEAADIAQVAVVVGGGNVLRGSSSEEWQIDRVDADNVGMLGTAINALLLRAAISSRGDRDVRVMSALPMPSVAEPYIRLRAARHLEKGRIVIMACGIGQPFVTTDYPSVQRAIELDADALLAAKNGVDGVYSADPNTDPHAARFDSLTFDEVIRRELNVMDMSAFLLAREHGLPISVFDIGAAGAMAQVIRGEQVGTLIS
jgi:uridylate kinase